MKQTWLSLWLLIGSLTFLSGCWNKQELTDLAIVNAVGIDKTEEGKYLITFQIISPANVAVQQGSGQSAGIPVTVYSTTGNSIMEAARNGSKKISRSMYYAHTNLVVVGEELAREGTYEIFDGLERDPQFRTTASIVIAQNAKAVDMLKILTPIDKLPANKITKTLNFTEKALGENMDVSMDDVIKKLVNSGKQPVISGFKMVGDLEIGKGQGNLSTTEAAARIQAGGIAYFKEGKLSGWLNGKNARSVVWILDKIDQTDVFINWKKKKDSIGYKVIRGKTNIDAKIKKGKPVVTIHIKAEGDIRETNVPVDLTNPKVIHQLETRVKKTIKNEIMNSVKMLKEEETDIFGFGEVIHRTDPTLWKRLEVDWNEVGFPELEVNVDVEAYIRRTGLRNKSFLSEVK